MNEENCKKLTDRFPMFQSQGVDPRYPFPMFGFECGDGWFQLLWDLCEDLEQLEKKFLDSLPEEDKAKTLLEGGWPGLEVHQVKEKFGTLRFYVGAATDEMHDRINEAEKKSAEICEVCGKPGKIRGRMWIYCACDEHTREEDADDES